MSVDQSYNFNTGNCMQTKKICVSKWASSGSNTSSLLWIETVPNDLETNLKVDRDA